MSLTWPLVNPTFDGKTFSFQVDNGESLLTGEMKLVDGKFEGRWSSPRRRGGRPPHHEVEGRLI